MPEMHGKVGVVQGAHSVVMGAVDIRLLRAYAVAADRAVEQVAAVWEGTPTPHVVVLAPASVEDAAALLSTDEAALASTAAVTRGELRSTAGASTTTSATTADRIVLVPGRFESLSAAGKQAVLTHEVTHVITRAATVGFPPDWLSEGFADYIGFSANALAPSRVAAGLLTDVRAGRLPHDLPADDAFTLGRADAQGAYEQAWLACRLIAERFGQQRLVELYRRVANGKPLDEALSAVLGMSHSQFVASWRAYLRQLAGVTAG